MPHALPSQSGKAVLTCNARIEASGGEEPSFIARPTTSALNAERLVSIAPGGHLKPSTKRRKETTKPTVEMTTYDGARYIKDSPTLERARDYKIYNAAMPTVSFRSGRETRHDAERCQPETFAKRRIAESNRLRTHHSRDTVGPQFSRRTRNDS